MRFLYVFGICTPIQSVNKSQPNWDDEDSFAYFAFFVDAETAEAAMERGRDLSERFVAHLYFISNWHGPIPVWRAADFVHWIECDPLTRFPGLALATVPLVGVYDEPDFREFFPCAVGKRTHSSEGQISILRQSRELPNKDLILGFDSVLWGAMIAAMFIGQFWLIAAVRIGFIVYTAIVLYYARLVARAKAPTFAGQRFVGTVLYVLGHSLTMVPGQLPLELAGIAIFSTAIGIFLLFE